MEETTLLKLTICAINKLYQKQASLRKIVVVNQSQETKPAILLDTKRRDNRVGTTRGNVMLRVNQRLRINVGDPNS